MKKAFALIIAMLLAIFCTQLALTSCEKSSQPTPSEEAEEPVDPEDPEEPEEPEEPADTTWFLTRGLVLGATEISNSKKIDYFNIAKTHNLTTFSIYGVLGGYSLLQKKCADAGVDMEYEEHAIGDLLPSTLFDTHPEYFHAKSNGVRETGNPCPSCDEAMKVIRSRVPSWAKNKAPTNHKYYCWLEDGGDICHCEKCKGYSASEQALMLENVIIDELRKTDSLAQLAHLAYEKTWAAPSKVKPADGIFLEFAAFMRRYDQPLSNTATRGYMGYTHGQYLTFLANNLKVFPRETAQVLEYWCDESIVCGWDMSKLKELPWNNEVFLDDLNTYAQYGIRHITCYAAYVGPKYYDKFGFPQFICDYADGLKNYVKK